MLDIGQAVLKDLSVLSALDVIVVPELPDEQSQEKIRTFERLLESDRKSTRLNSSHNNQSRMPSSA